MDDDFGLPEGTLEPFVKIVESKAEPEPALRQMPKWLVPDPPIDAGLPPTLSARDMAELGATVGEIAQALGITTRQAALDAGDPTPAQLKRIAQVTVGRAIGSVDLAPHVQAAQFILANHLPEQYGRQAQAGGSATLRVIVDRDWTKRTALVHEGELVSVLPPPPLG